MPDYAIIRFKDEYYTNLALTMVPPVINDYHATIKLLRLYSHCTDTLRVSGLPVGMTESKVCAILEGYSPRDVKMLTKGEALVVFDQENDRNAAIIELDKTVTRGSVLRVEFSYESIVSV